MNSATTPVPATLAADGQASANQQVKTFYDTTGWQVDEQGVADDTRRFGVLQAGALRDQIHIRRTELLKQAFADAPEPFSVVECGCGGNPAIFLAKQAKSYTGVDFSKAGLELAARRLQAANVKPRLVQAEITSLPFSDASFSAVYSAHVLYHMISPRDQEAAMSEMMRVLRPGGVAVLIVANPRPLLFPLRLVRRMVADAPVVSWLANRIRKPGPLPYRPMPIGWMRRRLAPHGEVRITSYAFPSVWMAQHVHERNMLSRALWRCTGWLESRTPRLAAYLGNFIMITVRKPGRDQHDRFSRNRQVTELKSQRTPVTTG